MKQSYLTTKEAAALVRLSAATIKKFCRSGELRSERQGADFRIPREVLNEWIASRRKFTYTGPGGRLAIEVSAADAPGEPFFFYIAENRESGFFLEVLADNSSDEAASNQTGAEGSGAGSSVAGAPKDSSEVLFFAIPKISGSPGALDAVDALRGAYDALDRGLRSPSRVLVSRAGVRWEAMWEGEGDAPS